MINLRSPYYITVTNTNLTQADLELYVYTGTQTTDRGTAKYTIQTPSINAVSVFEISELVRDYLEYTFNGAYDGVNVWVDYRIKEYISGVAGSYGSYVQLLGFDGYGYFEEGVNPQTTSQKLISNSTVFVLSNSAIRIPIKREGLNDVKVYTNSGLIQQTDYISSAESNEQIVYFYYDTLTEMLKTRVLADSGVFEAEQCLLDSLGTDNDIPSPMNFVINDSETIVISQITECKFTPYKVTFVNKFGALQDLYFFKKSVLNVTTKDEKYKSNIINNGSYSISEHQNKILNKQASQKLTLNSGFYTEDYNEVFEQMLFSELVWIEMDGNTLPININTSSFTYKTQLNDKLIQYTIDVDFAHDKINNIR
jgi:hypothetical protein